MENATGHDSRVTSIDAKTIAHDFDLRNRMFVPRLERTIFYAQGLLT
jgi:hypothetical protein